VTAWNTERLDIGWGIVRFELKEEILLPTTLGLTGNDRILLTSMSYTAKLCRLLQWKRQCWCAMCVLCQHLPYQVKEAHRNCFSNNDLLMLLQPCPLGISLKLNTSKGEYYYYYFVWSSCVSTHTKIPSSDEGELRWYFQDIKRIPLLYRTVATTRSTTTTELLESITFCLTKQLSDTTSKRSRSTS